MAAKRLRKRGAITPGLLLQVLKGAVTHVDHAEATLLCGAFFFTMRSCKYSKVSGYRRTKIIKIKNVRFFLEKKVLSHDDPRLLPLADSVTIHFKIQKNDERNEKVTQQRNFHASLCPVRLWAAIIQCIRSYKGTTDETTVNTVLLPDGKLHELQATLSYLFSFFILAFNFSFGTSQVDQENKYLP